MVNNNPNDITNIIKRLSKFPTPHEERIMEFIDFQDIAEKLSKLSPSLRQEAAALFVKYLKKYEIIK